MLGIVKEGVLEENWGLGLLGEAILLFFPPTHNRDSSKLMW